MDLYGKNLVKAIETEPLCVFLSYILYLIWLWWEDETYSFHNYVTATLRALFVWPGSYDKKNRKWFSFQSEFEETRLFIPVHCISPL